MQPHQPDHPQRKGHGRRYMNRGPGAMHQGLGISVIGVKEFDGGKEQPVERQGTAAELAKTLCVHYHVSLSRIDQWPYQLVFTDWFDRNLKAIGKHNPALRQEIEAFLLSFDAEAHPIIPGTAGARKARMRAKGRGKRGGYRVIYYLALADTFWLMTIYDKVEKEDLTADATKQIAELVEAIRSNKIAG